ncbi:hypothetical protein D9M71_443050 [compost metagenome]
MTTVQAGGLPKKRIICSLAKHLTTRRVLTVKVDAMLAEIDASQRNSAHDDGLRNKTPCESLALAGCVG